MTTANKRCASIHKLRKVSCLKIWPHTTLDTNAGAKGLKLLRDLKGQLPGRGEHQGVEPLGRGQQRLQDWQSKGTGLSGTSFSQANNILP